MMLRRLAGILLLAALTGCASASPTAEDRWLSYRDGSEYFWPTTQEDAIRKAAAQSDQQFAKHMPGARSTLTPYPRVPGAWQWTLPARTEESGRIAWLAQFTLAVAPDVDADTFVGGVLQSLTTSREARCYEARMRELGALR